ncbi:MAG: HU family DNA-binding protein, partial [Bacteroidales bacterium]|nr:HU family DNA-binding protein [Candidatus Sodaliphilus fimicaballi]
MDNKITFPELIELVAQSTNTSKRMSELFLKELFATISQSLINGDSVKIKNLGTFKVEDVKPRKSVSVNTGQEVEIPSHKRLTFTPAKSLADSINEPFAHFETVMLSDD